MAPAPSLSWSSSLEKATFNFELWGVIEPDIPRDQHPGVGFFCLGLTGRANDQSFGSIPQAECGENGPAHEHSPHQLQR